MSYEATIADIRRELQAVATEERRIKEKEYLKSELDHIGASVPNTRKITKAALSTLEEAEGDLTHRSLWSLTNALWSHRVHELRAAAVEALDAKKTLLRATDMKRLVRLLREARTWALLDALSVNVVGDVVERFPECAETLDVWATDDDFWVRRAAMLSLLKPLRQGGGDFDRFSRYADAMLEEREFFIRKAIGWILRETSKKRPELVAAWIEPRIPRASGVTVREAVKKLPNADALLAAYRAR